MLYPISLSLVDQSCCLPLPNEDNTSPGEEEQVKPESSRKPKRSRTAFTESQLDELELEFYKHKYPDVYTRESIARRLNIKADRVQV